MRTAMLVLTCVLLTDDGGHEAPPQKTPDPEVMRKAERAMASWRFARESIQQYHRVMQPKPVSRQHHIVPKIVRVTGPEWREEHGDRFLVWKAHVTFKMPAEDVGRYAVGLIGFYPMRRDHDGSDRTVGVALPWLPEPAPRDTAIDREFLVPCVPHPDPQQQVLIVAFVYDARGDRLDLFDAQEHAGKIVADKNHGEP